MAAKKEILDSVLSRSENNFKSDQEDEDSFYNIEFGKPAEKPRAEKNLNFIEAPLATYSGAQTDQDESYFGNISAYLSTSTCMMIMVLSGDLPEATSTALEDVTVPGTEVGGLDNTTGVEAGASGGSAPAEEETSNLESENEDEPRPAPGVISSSTQRPSAGDAGEANQDRNNFVETNEDDDNDGDNYGFPESFGRAGLDFPIYGPDDVPQTSFTCENKLDGG